MEKPNIFLLLGDERTPETADLVTNVQAIRSLHNEMMNFVNHISPSDFEAEMRKTIFGHVTKSVHKVFPDAKVNVYGSTATDLCLPTSNINMVVSGAVVDRDGISRLGAVLEEDVAANGRVRTVTCRNVATLIFAERISGIQVEISFDDAESKLAVVSVIRTALQEHPEMRQLVLVVKTFLRHRNACDGFAGGLTSHAVVLMALHFLQLYPVTRTQQQFADDKLGVGQTLGLRLMQFLRLYGDEFDHNNGLSVREGGFVFPKASRGWSKPPLAGPQLAVEDPVSGDNVAEDCIHFGFIKSEFSSVYRAMFNVCFTTTPPKTEGTVLSLAVFGRVYNASHDARMEVVQRWSNALRPPQPISVPQQQPQQSQQSDDRRAAPTHRGPRGGGSPSTLTPVEVDSKRFTTVMMRNLPNKYGQVTLLEDIDKDYKGSYDFFYLPIDYKNECNLGYAFINFTSEDTMERFTKQFSGHKWERYNSHKVCQVSRAKIQGKAALIDHFQNSSVMAEDEALRPLIWYSDGPMKGLPEPFPVGPNVRPRAHRPPTDRTPRPTTLGAFVRSGRPKGRGGKRPSGDRNVPGAPMPGAGGVTASAPIPMASAPLGAASRPLGESPPGGRSPTAGPKPGEPAVEWHLREYPALRRKPNNEGKRNAKE